MFGNQRGSRAIDNHVLDQIGVVGVGIVFGCEGLGFWIAGGGPASFSHNNGDVGEVEAAEGEASGIEHGVEEIGVVEEGVRVDFFFGGREGFEEGRVKRDDATRAHERVVRIEVEHERGVGGGEEGEEREKKIRC